MRNIAITLALAFLANFANAQASNPYAAQKTRAIKSLSNDEIQSYLAGKGMGFARAAELNGYPGPSHVLALADKLQLTPLQERQTKELFAQMESDASALGGQLVAEERALNQLFASGTVTPTLLASATEHIGVIQGRIRNAHLKAHIAQAAVLTPEQMAQYNQLHGYTEASAHEPHQHAHH